ncbi:hypothetical protein QM285_22520, partial [Stutzerimonas stutzeri]|nr:hypothetical protein [Stutzerimonas stutzeri]
LVRSTTMKQRPVALVVLDAFGKDTHMADANRLKKWREPGTVTPGPAAALAYKQQKQAQRKLAGQQAEEEQARREKRGKRRERRGEGGRDASRMRIEGLS